MPSTSKGIRYPSPSAAPNVPQDMQNLASDVNSRMSTYLGGGFYSGTTASVVTTTPSWTDVATFTGTSLGGECFVQWVITLANGNSGADRTGSLRVICDATQLGTIGPVSLLLANLPRIGRAGEYSSTPGAGSHTWKLQANGSAASSVVAEMAAIHVIER